MIVESSNGAGCAADLILADLQDADLLELAPGERLWKLYCFIAPEGKATGLRHRIYTKMKPDGRLALATFAVHSPSPGRFARSAVARVPDLPPEALDRIIHAIQEQTHATPADYEEIDLSAIPTLAEQLRRLGPGEG